jgi:hypothetical protein
VHYPSSNVKKVRTCERDVLKVDWYKLSLKFIQMSVTTPSFFKFALKALIVPFATKVYLYVFKVNLNRAL